MKEMVKVIRRGGKEVSSPRRRGRRQSEAQSMGDHRGDESQ